MTQFKYRPDIDGLRAVAVLLVLLFHAHLGFPGGYVGVDVFFVISGYLITSIILKAQGEDKFSLTNFWIRRLRRILPASIVVVVTTLIAGYFLLLPRDLIELGEAACWQQAMLSNVYFWRSDNYFAGPAEIKPLLHTWSLAVEEQFYLGYPFLLVLCRRWDKRLLIAFLVLLSSLSFILSIWGVENSPTATFFLLPTRMWELLLGGLVALAPSRSTKKRAVSEAGAIIGISAILLAGCFFDSQTSFPGAMALIPCLGAALVIQTSKTELTWVGKCLSAKGIVFIGLISYSLYLWHWPLLAYSHYWGEKHLNVVFSILIFIASFLLAYLSWKYVETPFRSIKKKQEGIGRQTAMQFFCSVIFICGIGYTAALFQGFPNRIPTNVSHFTQKPPSLAKYNSAVTLSKLESLPVVGISSHGKPDFLVWGDSHASSIASLMNDLGKRYSQKGEIAASHAVAPLLDTWKFDKYGVGKTINWNAGVSDYVTKNKIQNVILASRWSQGFHDDDGNYKQDGISDPKIAFSKGLDHTLSELEASGSQVWLLKQVPEQAYDRIDILAVRSVLLGNSIPSGSSLAIYLEQQREVNLLIDEVASRHPRTIVLNPAESCFEKDGSLVIADQDKIYYKDIDHLNSNGTKRYLTELFEPLFQHLSDKSKIRSAP